MSYFCYPLLSAADFVGRSLSLPNIYTFEKHTPITVMSFHRDTVHEFKEEESLDIRIWRILKVKQLCIHVKNAYIL